MIFINLRLSHSQASVEIELFIGLNVHDKTQDGIFIFHDENLIFHRPSNSLRLTGISVLLQITNAFDEIHYTREDFKNSIEFKRLVSLVSKNLEYYYLSKIENNSYIQISTLWERCGYLGTSQIADPNELYARFRYCLSPMVIRCCICKKYRNEYELKAQARPGHDVIILKSNFKFLD